MEIQNQKLSEYKVNFNLEDAIGQRKKHIIINRSAVRDKLRVKALSKFDTLPSDFMPQQDDAKPTLTLDEVQISIKSKIKQPNQLTREEQKAFKKMLKILINSEKEISNSNPKSNKPSAKFINKLKKKIDKCSDTDSFKSILEDYSKAKKNGEPLPGEIYENLASKTLEYGMLDWTAIFLNDMENAGIRVGRKILDDFLRMNYVQKILNNYYNDEDDSENESDKEEEKKKEISPRKESRISVESHEKVSKIVKYLKRLSSQSEEFYPESKKFIVKDPIAVEIKEVESTPNKELNQNLPSKTEEKKAKRLIKKEKLKQKVVKKSIQEFNPYDGLN